MAHHITFSGIIQSGLKDASASWNWKTIREAINDQTVHDGTINIRLDDFDSFNFAPDINFLGHVKTCGIAEALQFQRCHIRVGEKESHAFIAKTPVDYWGQRGALEVVAPFIKNVDSGVFVEISIAG